MMDGTLLQATGGSPTVVAAVLVGRLLAVVLAVVIAYRAYSGYREVRSVPLLYLAAGIVLVSVVPILVAFALPTFTTLPQLYVELLLNASKLAGLGAILYSLYGDPGGGR